MIQFTDNHNCCGCSACAQKCPAHCISMKENEEGFLYPEVNADLCVNCDLCKTICPALNVEAERTPIKCYAITGSNDEIVMKSSSVGLFSLLAEYVIKNNGVVFGASFDSKWGVQHTYTEDIDGLVQFRGSKYVQSRIGNCYYKAEEFLKANRIVLFSGTACQILGLKRYLKRDYPNLLCVDVVCHGVPSPGVWNEYLRSLISPKRRTNTVSSSLYSQLSETEALRIKDVSFRDKRLGWKRYSFVVLSSQREKSSKDNSDSFSYKPIVRQKHYYNIYIRGFLHNFMLRESCYDCPAKGGRSMSDITLGDFWGIKKYYPSFASEDGVGLALIYSERGLEIFNAIAGINRIEITYEEALSNTTISKCADIPIERKTFFDDFRRQGISALHDYCKKVEPNPIMNFFHKAYIKLKIIILSK